MISDKSCRVLKKDFENILKIYCDYYTEEVKNNYSKMSPIHIGHPVVCIINIRADDKLPQFFILHECYLCYVFVFSIFV